MQQQELLHKRKREAKLLSGKRNKKWLHSQKWKMENGSLSYLLAYLGHVSTRQHFQVRFQGTGLQDAAVFLLIVGLAKQDVVAQCGILYPSLLRHVRQRALERVAEKHRRQHLVALIHSKSLQIKKNIHNLYDKMADFSISLSHFNNSVSVAAFASSCYVP